MGRESNGIVRNAFYKQNTRKDIRRMSWGRTQGANMKPFEYEEDENGNIKIVRNNYKAP